MTQVLSWVVEAAQTIVSEPLLMLGLIFFVLGGAIGIIGRLLSRNAVPGDHLEIVDASPAMRLIYRLHSRH